MSEKPISTNAGDFEKFSKSGSSMPTLIYWLTFTLSLVFVGFFWFLGFNTGNALEEKEQEKDQIAALLSSPDIVEVEEQANNFTSAVSQLSTVSASRVKKTKLLEDLFGYFTKDVRVSTLSLSSNGELSLDGVSSSYKSVGEFMLALKEYERISNIKLGSVSLSSEDAGAGENVKFSLTSNIDLSKGLTESEEADETE